MKRLLKFYIITAVVCLVCGCDAIRGLKVMKQNEFEDLLYDIHITESSLAVLYPNLTPQELQQQYDNVFKQHHTTHEEFNRAIDYYSHQPHKFEEIYVHVYSRIDQLEHDVKDYVYHPELKHLRLPDTLTQVDIYAFPKAFKMIRPKGENAVFHITDERLLQPGDCYQWQFTFRAMPYDTVHYDTLHHTCLRFVVEYNNGEMKAITHHIKAKGESNRYTFTIQTPDSLKPVSVSGSYFFGKDSVQWIQVNEASCRRLFNIALHPLDDETLEVLDSISSCAHRELLTSTRLKLQEQTKGKKTDLVPLPLMMPDNKVPRLPTNVKVNKTDELQKVSGK